MTEIKATPEELIALSATAVTQLAKWRAKKKVATDAFSAFMAEIEESVQYVLLSHEADIAKEQTQDYEIVIKELAAKIWKLTSDQHPHEAVTVNKAQTVLYDEALAIGYCLLNQPLLLDIKLRKRDFESFARNHELSFVTFTLVPKVTIKGNLSQWLPSNDEIATTPAEPSPEVD